MCALLSFSGNGWGSVDIAMMQIPTSIVYGLPWSGTNATYDPFSGYWSDKQHAKDYSYTQHTHVR